MSSPSQRRGGCGHMMAGFDTHAVCARCRDKKKGSDPCVETPPKPCSHCSVVVECKFQNRFPKAEIRRKTGYI